MNTVLGDCLTALDHNAEVLKRLQGTIPSLKGPQDDEMAGYAAAHLIDNACLAADEFRREVAPAIVNRLRIHQAFHTTSVDQALRLATAAHELMMVASMFLSAANRAPDPRLSNEEGVIDALGTQIYTWANGTLATASEQTLTANSVVREASAEKAAARGEEVK